MVDDDVQFGQLVCQFLNQKGFETCLVTTANQALKQIKIESFDLILTDYRLPDFNGLELMEKVHALFPESPVVLISHYADIRMAVNSIKSGAFEFVSKPVVPDELLRVVHAALEKENRRVQPVVPKSEPESHDIKYVTGRSPGMIKLWEHVNLVAATKLNVLVTGESGTGKEHIARTLHALSHRKDKPFVAVDCGTLSPELAASELFGHEKGAFTGAHTAKEGLFAMAQDGTLFLDETGNLSLEVQMMLLRVLQEGRYKKVGGNAFVQTNVRIVAATNENLSEAIQNGLFRMDLFHRLNEFELQVPPLRNRSEDIEELCEFFIRESCREFGKHVLKLHPDVLTCFKQYSWPGNVRELKNMIQRAVLLSQEDEILPEVLPAGLLQGNEEPAEDSNTLDLKLMQRETEKERIRKALIQFNYNKSKAAKALNIDRTTLYNKIKQYNLMP